jgi:hypothetical protein
MDTTQPRTINQATTDMRQAIATAKIAGACAIAATSHTELIHAWNDLITATDNLIRFQQAQISITDNATRRLFDQVNGR